MIRILRYIKGTLGQGVLYGDHTYIVGYCDAEWVGSLLEIRSTFRYVYLLEAI